MSNLYDDLKTKCLRDNEFIFPYLWIIRVTFFWCITAW